MKRFLVPIGLLVFFALCFVPNSQAQSPCTQYSQGSAPGWQLALLCNFNASSGSTGGFNTAGLQYWKLTFVPSGTVSAASLSLDSSATGLSGSWSTGGILASGTIGSMTSAGSYGPNSTALTPSSFARLTPSITGTGSVQVVLYGYVVNPVSGGAGITITTVSGLASVSGKIKGTIASVTDGNSATDCTTGGGSTVVNCQYSGTVWAQMPALGSGSGTITGVTAGTGLSGGGSSGSVTLNNTGVITATAGVGISNSGSGTAPIFNAETPNTVGATGTTPCDRFNTQVGVYPGRTISAQNDR